MTMHLEIPNPDDVDEMPLIDVYADDWSGITQTISDHLIPGRYYSIRTIDTETGEEVETGYITLNDDNSVEWEYIPYFD